jgi:CHAT domain-containing protein
MSDEPRTLVPDQPVEDRLQPGAVHVYGFQVGKDEFVHVIAEQRGLDVRLHLLDPAGRLLAEIDTPNGGEGTEEVTEVADAGGSYRLEVHSVSGEGGSGTYRVRIAEQRPATFVDRLRLAAERAFGSAEGLRRQGQAELALASYRLASELWREVSDPGAEALAAYRMGWMEDELGRTDAADAQYKFALDRLGVSGNPSLRATILNRWGRNHLTRGLEQSRAAHERAYMLFRALKNAAGQAASLHNLGNAYRALGADGRARQCYEMALTLWRQAGDAGEEAKTARNLAGLAGSPGGPAGVEATLTQALAPDAAGGKSPAAGGAGAGPCRQGEVVALAALGAAFARDGKLDEAADCYAKIFAPSLDAATLVLWYELGDDRSVLWTATAGGRASHYLLPRRASIEAAARRLFELAPQDGSGAGEPLRRAAEELSLMLLAPAARELGEQRLLLVVDGALDRVPFALLPEPDAVDGRDTGGATPLLAKHEIIHLSPAIAPMAVGRRRSRQQEALQRGPAVVGDPVVRLDDPRFEPAVANAAAGAAPGRWPALDRALQGLGLGEPPALLSSRREAEAVAALLPESNRYCALGFEANPELLSTLSRRYQMLHLAALALLAPAGSGLVLSLYDRRGGSRAGYLPLSDLSRLDLPLSLLVVTGSRVAWEAERGGLGLAEAAMQAGAARVVTSLWSAEDESAVELMRRFYQAILEQRSEPAAALRQAQLAVAGDPRWSSPRHWAGFIFSGAWDQGAPAARVSESAIEASDTGGTGGGGKPDSDFPPPPQPSTA